MIAATGWFVASNGFATDAHTTNKFEGVKANTGMAAHARIGTGDTLAVSDDFKIPETPAPHWNVYLLNHLKIKDGKTNRKIALPSYVHDVPKVQVWCSFAKALLGEASFAKPITTASGERMHSNSMAISR